MDHAREATGHLIAQLLEEGTLQKHVLMVKAVDSSVFYMFRSFLKEDMPCFCVSLCGVSLGCRVES